MKAIQRMKVGRSTILTNLQIEGKEVHGGVERGLNCG